MSIAIKTLGGEMKILPSSSASTFFNKEKPTSSFVTVIFVAAETSISFVLLLHAVRNKLVKIILNNNVSVFLVKSCCISSTSKNVSFPHSFYYSISYLFFCQLEGFFVDVTKKIFSA